MNTIVSDIAPSAGFQINMAPTTMDKIAVSNVHKSAGTSRVANAARTPNATADQKQPADINVDRNGRHGWSS